MHVAHRPNPTGRHITACGQLWQRWQAPEEYADGSRGQLPGPAEPVENPPACPICDAVWQRWDDEAPLRERAAEAERVRAEAQAEVARARRS